jgi:MFS family permease
MIGYFATAPLFGYLGDRLPRRWLIAAGVLAWCAGTMLSGAAGGFASLLCFRILVGLGEASYGTIGPAWIADAYPAAQRNNALSLFYIALPVGSALGFVAGGAIAAHWGWRAAFVVAGLPAVALTVPLFFCPEPPRPAPRAARISGGWRAAAANYWGLIRTRTYRLVVLGYVAQSFTVGGFGVYAAAFFERRHHMTFAAADRFFGLSLVAMGLVATLAGGALGTWWQRKSRAGYGRLLALSAVLAVPPAFGTFLLREEAWAQASLVVTMFFIFLPTGPLNTMILETAPAALRASAMAGSIFAIHLFGDLWSPLIVGALSDRFGSLRDAILITLPVALVVCAGFWLRLAGVLRRDAPAPPEPGPANAGCLPGRSC